MHSSKKAVLKRRTPYGIAPEQKQETLQDEHVHFLLQSQLKTKSSLAE